MKKETNYVIAIGKVELQRAEGVMILGWDTRFEMFDDMIDFMEITVSENNYKVKKNENGLIPVSRYTTAYGWETLDEARRYLEEARNAGIRGTICKVEKTPTGIKLIPHSR